MKSAIHYLTHQQIDKVKWDACIDNSKNGLIYAYSYYLDHMARNWDALVYGEYDAVMPLPWNKKFGIHYLYEPAFTASLGIFGNGLNPTLINEFIKAIPSKFKLIEIDLNAGNNVEFPVGISIMRNNYVLDLSRSYTEIEKGYRENIRRNVKKAKQFECACITNVDIDQVITLSEGQMANVGSPLKEDYDRFRSLFAFLKKKEMASTYGVLTKDQQMLASSVYFYSHGRAYYILVGNHPNGKAMGTSHYLIDRFIFNNAGKNLLLDFEGSDLRNLAFFYSSFGAVHETYPALRINRLPWWVKLFKS